MILNILPHSGSWIQVDYHLNWTKTEKNFISLTSFVMLIMYVSMTIRNLMHLLSTLINKNKKRFLLYGSLSIAGGDSLIK